MEKFEKLQDFVDSSNYPGAEDIAELIENKDFEGLYKYLNAHRDELRSYEGYKEVELTRPDIKKTIEQLSEEYPDGNVPEEYQSDIARELNITTDELNAQLHKSIDEKKIDEQVDEEAEGRTRRAKEIADMPWYKKMLMNEYSQKRYIEDPDNSIFGKEGKFNPYSTEGQNELRDVILGATGTVADFIPGIGGIAFGPAVRAGRDIAAGEKSAGDIIKNTAFDAVTNAVLARGLKGIPGIQDLGPVRNIEEKFPVSEWAEKVKSAEAKDLSKVNFPPIEGSKKELRDWIEKQPAEYRKRYFAELEKGSDANINKVFRDIMNDDIAFEVKRGMNEQWVREHPIKAGLGKYGEGSILGAERTAVKSKTSGDYNDKIDPKEEKEKRKEESKTGRWLKGFATIEEQGTPEYKAWKDEQLKKMMGVD